MTKKFLALLLAVVMVCAMGVIPVSAEPEPEYEAQIGDDKYETLEDAFSVINSLAGDSVTITLLKDVVLSGVKPFGEGYVEALYYLGSKTIILDLNGCDITMGSEINEYGFYFRNNDSNKENTISFINSKCNDGVSVITGGKVYGTITVNHGSNACGKTTLSIGNGVTVQDMDNKPDMPSSGGSSEDQVIYIRNNAVCEIESGAKIIAKGSEYATNALLSTSVVNIYDGATIIHEGSTGIAVMGQGTSNIYGGTITAKNNVNAVQPASTGEGVINISGGTIEANNNAVYLGASYDEDGATKISVNITGGTITGNLVTNVNTTNPQNAAAINIAKNPETGIAPVITGNVTVSENASIKVDAGELNGNITANSGATATISGGTITGTLTVSNNSTFTVTGGTFEDDDAKDVVADLLVGNGSNDDFGVDDDGNVLQKYTATFKADGDTVDTVDFLHGDTTLSRIPAVPEKKGYVGYWESYTLNNEDVEIKAVYVKIPERYRVSFVADGKLVGIILYRANQDELTVLPKVPAKEGYVGTWAEYTLTGKNMIVRAVYTPIAE